MSRWADDPERAADSLIARSLDAIAPRGRMLLANQGGRLPDELRARGLSVVVWNRRVVNGQPAAPEPPAGPFDMALVRLPKARDEQVCTTHAALNVLSSGGRLILYGGNDEGIRGAATTLEALTGSIETLAIGGHGRVLAANRPEHLPGLRGRLADWRMVARISITGLERPWVSYPGVFAANRIDDGTALLLSVLPALAPGARVLDFACGTGLIGAAVVGAQPTASIDMIDNDSVALEAARENVPAARRLLGASLKDVRAAVYDLILSNPPLHEGIAQTRALLDRLVADAPAHLAPAGLLQLVVQRRIALDRLIGEHFGKAEIVAEDGSYRVWRARRK
jgi:16S rRNA (guanine1207-N2)-methyltransferase